MARRPNKFLLLILHVAITALLSGSNALPVVKPKGAPGGIPAADDSPATTGVTRPKDRDASISLSDVVSSPERYARALGLTTNEVIRQRDEHVRASEELYKVLRSSTELSGNERHNLICKNRFLRGRHPFCCKRCWSYLPVCICDEFPPDEKKSLPGAVEIIVWVHHREWGLTSNTGSVLAMTLSRCRLLMKGLAEHDDQLQKILDDEDCLSIVLWPEEGTVSGPEEGSTVKEKKMMSPIDLDEVQEAINNHRRVVFVAIDGTWRNARRMVPKLPTTTVRRLDLPVEAITPVLTGPNEKSLLAPLRSKGPSQNGCLSDRQVCTAEAVVAALLQLGLSQESGDYVLSAARRKVDLVRRYRGKAT